MIFRTERDILGHEVVIASDITKVCGTLSSKGSTEVLSGYVKKISLKEGDNGGRDTVDSSDGGIIHVKSSKDT